MRPIKTAVFPVAGLGTRFLPATKAMPKEMLTVVDRPLIQHVVDEAREAGIENFVFVTGRGKQVIEDHFDMQPELETTLQERGKTAALDEITADLPPAGRAIFTRQQAPLGLGHAVWCAREIVGNEPFALVLPDVLVKNEPGCLKQMVDLYGEIGGGNLIAVERCPMERISSYGVVATGETRGRAIEVTGMVEKPKPEDAPSDLIITGRYILEPEIFELLENQEKGAGGEIQITDAMQRLMETRPFHALVFEGRTYDCGAKIGFLAANLAYGLDRPDLADELRTIARELLAEGS